VGTVSTAIGTTFVNLGVKGGVNHPADARMPWKTPPVPGHYCLHWKARTYAFEVDTYRIPDPEACKTAIGPDDRGTFAERLRRIKLRHDRGLFPVPAGWSVQILLVAPHLLADQEIDVAVDITPPVGFTGMKPFNVNAVSNGAYAGGVSLVVSKT
jgi:hypothetical protein